MERHCIPADHQYAREFNVITRKFHRTVSKGRYVVSRCLAA
jgi:hypothetical protein